MGLPRSALMLVLVTLMLISALELSYGQNKYPHAIAIAQTSVEFQVAAIGHEVHFSSIFFLFSSSLDSKGAPGVVLTSECSILIP
jgi:hypothetical protein